MKSLNLYPLKDHCITNKQGNCTIKFSDNSFIEFTIPFTKVELFKKALYTTNQETELANFLRDL